MSNRDLMFAAWVLIGGYFISQIMQASYFGDATDIDVANSLMAFRTYHLFGLIPIPLLNISFFTTGLTALTDWNMMFFESYHLDIFKYVFYVLTIGLVWGCAVTFVGVAFWRSSNIL